MLQRHQQRKPSLTDITEFFDEETLLVNDPIFSREAITGYVGTQEKSDNLRKRRSNNKNYGSFATDIDHHQPETQDKCILWCHKHNLDNCEEYKKKSIKHDLYNCEEYMKKSIKHYLDNCEEYMKKSI